MNKHQLKLSKEEILSFLKGISNHDHENENDNIIIIDTDLLNRAKNRLKQQLEIKNIKMSQTENLPDEKLIDLLLLLEEEISNENLFIVEKLTKEINITLEHLVEKFKTMINQTLTLDEEKQIINQINLEIDEIKGKVRDSIYYTSTFEQKSFEKRKIMTSLNLYIKRLESNMKYLEDIKENYEMQKSKFMEIEKQYPEEVSKLFDDNHRLNDLINIKNHEYQELRNLYKNKDYENYAYSDKFNTLNAEIHNLKIENEKLKNNIIELKNKYDCFVENVDIIEKEEYFDTIEELLLKKFNSINDHLGQNSLNMNNHHNINEF